MNEVGWQSKIIKRVRDEGGYGKKWATQYSVGVPDLVTVLTHLDASIMALIEVKLEKSWAKNTMRTIDFTPKQVDELNSIREARGVAFGLVVVCLAPRHTLLAPVMPPKRREILRVSKDELLQNPYHWEGKQNLSKFLITWKDMYNV